jgi:RND family efflux transporter MFP subunit
VESLLRAWLTLQCRTITGAEAGLVLLGSTVRAPSARVAQWPSEGSPSPRLSATVESAREQGKLVAQAPGDVAGAAPAATELALPISLDGRVAGAFGVSVRGLPVAEIKALAGLLGYGVRTLELLLEEHRGREILAARLAVAGSLLEHPHLAHAAHGLAAELARDLGCERVAVGLRRGDRVRVLALSSGLRFAEQSETVQCLRAAMEEALDQDAVIALPALEDAPQHAVDCHERLTRSSGADAVCSLPLASHGRGVGALTCEWAGATTPDAALREQLSDVAEICGPILGLMERAEAGTLERAKGWVARWSERHFGPNPALAKGALAATALLLLLLTVVPVRYRVSAGATLEGRVQRALVAGVSGYIREANARAGDLVKAGDVLARLDERDLLLERRKQESQKLQLEKEYRQALSGRDRTQVSILRAQIEQAAAQLGLVEEQLGRTHVVAPFDGVILEGDLDRSLGSPVELGNVLFEIAPLDGYRIILEIDGRDIADVAVGQRGRLALSALPGRALPLVVERITPMSTTQDGRSYFRAEAALEEPFEALRPGMEGIAKIDAGRRRLLWIWTHETFDWLRLWTWSFLP